jgi:FkbM family methyltransferase
MRSILGKIKRFLFPDMQFRKTSFSQCGEDVILDFLVTNLGIDKPSYLDIGAHHPYYLSNTALLYKKGATGINIEPNPQLYRRFLKARTKDTNLNIGVGNVSSELDFYILSVPTLCTFSKSEAQAYEAQGIKIDRIEKVKVETIDKVLQKYHDGKFPHILSLDVEGLDEDILRSINYKENYPLIICVESVSFSTFGSGIKQESLINFLLSNGYMIYAETYINTIFIMEKDWKAYAEKNKVQSA